MQGMMGGSERPPEFDWVKDGTPVWYRPSLSKEVRYAGRVKGLPWAIGGSDGDGPTWVALLVDMEHSYRNGQRATAAYLGALEPRIEAVAATDEDIATAILAMPEERRCKLLSYVDPDYVEAKNIGCSVLIKKLTEILDTGEQKGTFGGSEIQDFAERLLELRGQADPGGFGVDPQDSDALCAIRQACDDHLVWPSEAQREGGDYVAAVEHSGKLARFAERWFKEQQELLKGFPR